MKKRVLFWVLLVGLVVIDQAVKFWVRTNLAPGQYIAGPLPGLIQLTLVYNKGIAFGLFGGAGTLLSPVAIVIAIGSIWYSSQHPKEVASAHVAAALLASGALGNLYDRLVHQQVTDMFQFEFINFPVFNVADACITVAAFLLIWNWLREAVHEKKAPALKPVPPPPSSLE